VALDLDLPEHELFLYMKLAHKQDITLNQFIEQALQEAIDRHREELELTVGVPE
jgi:hypothetical protein